MERLHDHLNQLIKEKNFSGNVYIEKNGAKFFSKSAGFANILTYEEITEQSVFEVASVTKLFTALATIKLCEQGKLQLSDSLHRYLNLPYDDVTIEHCLTHTSGLPDYMTLFDEHWKHNTIATNADVLRLLREYSPPMHFPAGTQYEYSNTAYVLLASVIEKASGIRYKEFLQHYIFEEANMKQSTIFHRRYDKASLPFLAYGYIYNDKEGTFYLPDESSPYRFVQILDGIEGDGMLHTTVLDLANFATAFRQHMLLSTYWQRNMCKPHILNNNKLPCGYGFYINESPLGKKLAHGGGWPGYRSSFSMYEEQAITIVVLSNVEHLENEKQLSIHDMVSDIEWLLHEN
ncbi:serine hydrolase domain-containing protein [Bacillus sp. Hm123]|uniref:serine hydrolase domain-containing protein n=1 Tax=Bacillus sp. Hm123 TaxID=3450745 RepID=UPI003F42CB15